MQIGPDWDFPSSIPQTPYAEARSIHWANGGFWACGKLGLGAHEKGWVLRLNERLGVGAYAAFDAPGTAPFYDLQPLNDALLVTGATDSVFPWPGGGEPVATVLRLPWEGIMRFHEEGALHSQFLRPRVYETKGSQGFTANGESSTPVTGSPVALPLTPEILAPEPVLVADPVFLALERQDPGAIQSFAQWAYYHRLSGAQSNLLNDDDGDGIINGLECYFGLNPRLQDALPALAIGWAQDGDRRVPALQLRRSTFAKNLPFGLEASPDLRGWLPYVEQNVIAQPVDAGHESAIILTDPQGEPLFFRIGGLPVPE
ncbi:MAG: hypothetical protein R3F11_27330 [Verrucomicrobiales bacterium]